MRFLKKILAPAISLCSLTLILSLSACAPKNSCDTLVCENGGTCAADFCNCPTGYDGPQCQNKTSSRYIGSYGGYTDPRNGYPTHFDTVDVYVSKEPLTLSVVRRRSPNEIYTGTLDAKTNTILIQDIVNEGKTTRVTVAIKTPTTLSTKRTLNLNVVEFINENKNSKLVFNGDLLP